MAKRRTFLGLEDEVKQKSLLLVDRHDQTWSRMSVEMSGSFGLSFLSSIPHLTYFPSYWPCWSTVAAGLQPGAWQWTHKRNSYTEANVSHGASPLQPDFSGQMCLASCNDLQALVCPSVYQSSRLSGQWSFLWSPHTLLFQTFTSSAPLIFV